MNLEMIFEQDVHNALQHRETWLLLSIMLYFQL